MNTYTVVLKLLNGIYQLTQLKIVKTANGAILQPLTIHAPVYNESRTCDAVFYKKNKHNTVFYKEVESEANKDV